jgi:hypothetical protein
MNENNISYLSNNDNPETGTHIYTADPLFLISLAVNIILLITTGLSEIMATSKCKYNSLWQLVTEPLAKKIRELTIEEDEPLEAEETV